MAAIRRGGRLELHIDGKPVATSSVFDPDDFDLTNDRPLRIGFGQTDYFHGKLRDVRLYSRAMTADAISGLASIKPS